MWCDLMCYGVEVCCDVIWCDVVLWCGLMCCCDGYLDGGTIGANFSQLVVINVDRTISSFLITSYTQTDIYIE